MPYISIIASFRNEEESLKKFISRITTSLKIKKIKNYEILFVDDYSVPMVEEADYNALSFAIDKGLIDGLKTYPQLRGFMIDKFGYLYLIACAPPTLPGPL